MENELRLWSVEIQTNQHGKSPARASYWGKSYTLNVAARDIAAAIDGAVEELRERFGDDWNEESYWVISANHKGTVNRIVELS